MIENPRQLANTRTKLVELEQLYATTEKADAQDQHVRELALRSLKKRINQFNEEIARYPGTRQRSRDTGVVPRGPRGVAI